MYHYSFRCSVLFYNLLSGLDESSPYIYIDSRACPRENGERLSYGFILIFEGVCNTPLLFSLLFSLLYTTYYILYTRYSFLYEIRFYTYPATLSTSSIVVIPCLTFSNPLSFSVFIPFFIAASLITLLEAFDIINDLISSSKTIISYIEVLP